MKRIYVLTEKKLKKLIQAEANRMQEQQNKELERQIWEKETSLASMQGQMNPHFLYNALEGIRGQAMIDDAPIIADISRTLADYFRYSISSKSDVATLSEELNNVKNYIRIQQFRFDDRFQVDIQYDEDDFQVLETYMPKLTLQPIVENAILHGFTNVRKDACIKIKIVKTLKSVNIIVSDNGIGMDSAALKNLNQKIRGEVSEEQTHGRHNGIAMLNVNKRIQLMFGAEYGMHISSIPEMGTDVELHLPFCVNRKELENESKYIIW